MHSALRFTATIIVAVLALTACSHASLGNRLATKATLSQLKDGDFQPVNAGSPGTEVNIYRYAKYGKYTVFDFSSEY